ncbi:Nascent polypeptide-associated complex protein [Candidatus Norongarragalina meridionalis]|nr:Nascent polypeptide-associated complex protein [Candidatus Norongarragalina meridionalis]
MMPKMDPRQMAKLMSQMGIRNESVDATRVVIEKADGSKIVVEPASVTAIDMQGQKSFQISGAVREEKAGAEAHEETDADLVVRECGCSREEAEKALAETNGDLAEAILKLKKE